MHLASYPNLSDIAYQKDLVKSVDKVREICTAALNLRNQRNLRVRQPLKSLTVVGKNLEVLKRYVDLIKDEVNVKEVLFSSEVEEFAHFVLKVNFQVVGKRIPNKIKDIIASVKQDEWTRLGSDKIKIAGEELVAEEFSLNLQPLNEEKAVKALDTGDVVIFLDTNINEALELEGFARDLVRGIQQARKNADLHVSDKINLEINFKGDKKLLKACEKFKDYICLQTLAAKINYNEALSDDWFQDEFAVEGHDIVIALNKT